MPSNYRVRLDPGSAIDPNARATDCAVNGTNAKRSAAAPGSSPAAAQRGAEGAGLDAGDARRSTIKGAVKRTTSQRQHNFTAVGQPAAACRLHSRIYTSLTDVTQEPPLASDNIGR
jgi:hypothetical protein